MLFYNITETGALRKTNKVDFNENKVFLIDDFKIIYLWIGSKASKKKKELSVKKAEKMKNDRNKSIKIQINNQNKEYGSFLAIMDILRKGITGDISSERRPELEIEIVDTMELIEAGIDPDLEAEITLAAHNLSQENHLYEDLCKKLAELQLSLLKNNPTEQDIKKKTEEIYKSSSSYDELCWLIAELSKLRDIKF
ncbi:MAG: hypothetical protein ACFE9I_01790 [Candidatus Hermodarchaeota archaeon]